MMSLLIRYTHIPFYFHFSITSYTSLIHHYTPLHQCGHTRSHSHSLHQTDLTYLMDTCFMIHMFISILSIPNMCPPVVWPIMSPCTMWSGTYYSFTSDASGKHGDSDKGIYGFKIFKISIITIRILYHQIKVGSLGTVHNICQSWLGHQFWYLMAIVYNQISDHQRLKL